MGNAACCCCPGRGKEQPNLGSPIKKRSCTDVLCFCVFFLYWAGMVGILVYTLLFGRVLRLINGFDDYGNTCGIDNKNTVIENATEYSNMDMSGRPYQFFTNYLSLQNSYAVCVKQCPDRELSNMADVLDFYNDTNSALCDISVNVTDYLSQSNCELSPIGCYGPCPAFTVPIEEPILNRCLPSGLLEDPFAFLANATLLSEITNFFGQYKFFNEIGGSFYLVWREFLGLMGIALGLSLLLVFMMRFLIKIVVWFIVVLAALAVIGCSVALWVTYYRLKTGIDEQEIHIIPFIGFMVDAEKAFLAYSIVATVFTVIILLIIIVMRKRLQLAVALFQEAGKVLEHSPLVLVQPLWTYLYHLVIIVLGIVMFILLAGVTDSMTVVREDMGQGKRTVIEYQDRDIVTYFWWYVLIGIIWMIEFASAVQELIIAGTVAEWFFTRDKKKLGCTICRATSRTVINHLGSAALGSFIIILVKIPRYILMKLDQKLKKSNNDCARFMLKCCICCLYCLEKFLRYINRNAYIVIAISGTNFCVARVKAFNTLLSNVLRVLAINTVGDFVLFLGKALVMAVNVIIAFFLFDKYNEGVKFGERQLFFLPILAVAICSYFIAHCFLSSFEMLVDTLLLCFCEDVKINDGTEEKPYFMSKTLMKFVANSSKALNKHKRTDESDGTPSEKRVLAAGDASAAASREELPNVSQQMKNYHSTGKNAH